MLRDTIIIKGQNEALSFYIEALSAGIYVDWEGVCPNLGINGTEYYKVNVDKERTLSAREGGNYGC